MVWASVITLGNKCSYIVSNLGIVKAESFVFAEKPDRLKLDSGEFFGPITVNYET